jgi:BirA family biotin operon repressor/biotin-[acetyl-CoA-carboxylase] ligase
VSGAGSVEPPLEAWADALEAAAAGSRFDRIRVIAETASTQDAAARLADGRRGLIVVAGRQTAGRGRHGRKWADTAGLGLAMTFVVDGGFDDQTLALAGGVAALRTASAVLDDPSRIGLKWPNDVVERASGTPRAPDAPGAAGPRKLAGVLVERRGPVALLGIGVNVRQQASDWPTELSGRCVSLRMLESQASRLDIACALVGRLAEAFGLSPEELQGAWEQQRVDR